MKTTDKAMHTAAVKHMRNAIAAATDVGQTNQRGQWIPAIPLPYFRALGRCECECGNRYRSKLRYREHYALAHILGLSS